MSKSSELTKGVGIIGALFMKFAGGAGITPFAGAPVSGTSGTYANNPQGAKGSLILDTTNGAVYQNTNTNASPTWTLLSPTTGASADGLGALGVARTTFNPTATAGDRTIGAHASALTIPISAVIVGGFVQVNTAFDSSDHTGTLAVNVESANDIISAAAISGAPWSTIGQKAIVPKANTPESTGIVLTAARAITFTVATKALTVGKATAFLYYVVGAVSA